MKYPIRYRMFLPLIGTLCLAACILRTVACLTVRDINGYFPASSLPEISAFLLLGGAVIALTYPLFHKEPAVRPLLFTSPVGIFPTGMVALSEALVCAELVPALFTSRTALGANTSFGMRLILVLTVVLGLIGIGYYVLCLLIREQTSEARAWFGMAALLFFALYAIYLYFDTTLPLNATTKLTSQLTYLSMAVYLLFDVRMSLGRPRYRLQVALGLITASLTAYAAFPALITRIVQGAVIDHSIFETVCTFCFFLFVCARLYALATLPADEPIPYLVGAGNDPVSSGNTEGEADTASVPLSDEPSAPIAEQAVEEGTQTSDSTEEHDL